MKILGAGLRLDVVLIRHAEPIAKPDRSPSQWQLSTRGEEDSRDLGAHLSNCGLLRIVTSPEEKAWATASAVAEALGVSVKTDHRLVEVQRPWTEGNFDRAVERYLQGSLVEGWEPMEQVVSRLVDALASHSGEGPIGFVTHGTAMACLVGAVCSIDRVLFWSDLTMPDAWTLSDQGATRLYHLES